MRGDYSRCLRTEVAMELGRWNWPIRIAVAVVVGFVMLTFVFGGHKAGDLSAGDKFIGVILAMVYGFLLFYLFGWPLIGHVGDRVGTLYTGGSNDNFRVVPEYSI